MPDRLASSLVSVIACPTDGAVEGADKSRSGVDSLGRQEPGRVLEFAGSADDLLRFEESSRRGVEDSEVFQGQRAMFGRDQQLACIEHRV